MSAIAEPEAEPPPERAAQAARYDAVRAQTEQLAQPLSAEDQAVQSMPDASPTKWHLAHVSWFFETFLLKRHLADYAAFNGDFDFLFNSYYEAVGARHPRPHRGLLTRPPLGQVLDFRHHVDDGMRRLIETVGVARWADMAPLVELGLQHEQQHQELLLTDIKHLFSCNPLLPAYRPDRTSPASDAATLGWCEVEGGLVEVGNDGTDFSFDCERPSHAVALGPFRLASRLVTNGEYLEFVRDGGYTTFRHWLSDGWAAVQSQEWRHPLYWQEDEEAWFEFTLAGLEPLDATAPVCHLSYYEADAFARWAGKRLPSEAEWEVVARDIPPRGNLLASGRLRPLAADPALPAPAQMFGDAWEWTQSPFGAYPGFKPAPGAIGEYNGKFMSNQFVLRGGACTTPDDHIRATYRNFFHPDARWQVAGLRLAEDA